MGYNKSIFWFGRYCSRSLFWTIQPLQNFTKRSVILSSDFPYFIVWNVPAHSNDGLNNAKFREKFGEFQPATTMKISCSAIVKNSRIALTLLLKMGFTMALKFMEKFSTISQEKAYHLKIGSRISRRFLMNLKLTSLKSFRNVIEVRCF